MRISGLIVAALSVAALCLGSCDVHEFPDPPETRPFRLKLHYETDMTEWEHAYNNSRNTVEVGVGDTYDNAIDRGEIRYVIRTYPIGTKAGTQKSYIQEFVFRRNFSDGYDAEFTLDMIPGEYNIRVWSDLVEKTGEKCFYDASNFAEIALTNPHAGNTDYRDAFRGQGTAVVVDDIFEREHDALGITMQRPLAKYEFVTDDLDIFIAKELDYLAKGAETKGEPPPTKIDMDSYRVVFYYSGFMPNTYNMNSDKPIDACLGVLFDSSLKMLDDKNASLGFDYVFVNGGETRVTVQIGLYDTEERLVSLSNPVNVVLKRSFHTIIKGSFLMEQAEGGFVIDPGFNGNHNIIIP